MTSAPKPGCSPAQVCSGWE